MLNYRPNGRRRLGRPLKRLLDEAETGLSKVLLVTDDDDDDDGDIFFKIMSVRKDVVKRNSVSTSSW